MRLLKSLNRRLKFIQTSLAPPSGQDCVLCGAGTRGLLCLACDAALPRIPQACPRCAAPTLHEVCGECLRHPPPFARASAALTYDFPVDKLIQALKYQGRLAFAQIFGNCLHQAVQAQPKPDVILPMPLHPRRLQERGFNQALLIAQVIAEQTQIPVEALWAARAIDTTPQAELSLDARRKNVRNAFICTGAVHKLHVAVVDDVMTSGATVAELSQTLLQAGAREISVWIAARAVLH